MGTLQLPEKEVVMAPWDTKTTSTTLLPTRGVNFSLPLAPGPVLFNITPSFVGTPAPTSANVSTTAALVIATTARTFVPTSNTTTLASTTTPSPLEAFFRTACRAPGDIVHANVTQSCREDVDIGDGLK